MVTTSLALTAVRIAIAILLDTAALVIWDIGTRSPVRLFWDVRAGLGDASVLVRGGVRFAIGAISLLAATAISAAVATRAVDFTIVECWALVTALIVEQLVGPQLRGQRQ